MVAGHRFVPPPRFASLNSPERSPQCSGLLSVSSNARGFTPCLCRVQLSGRCAKWQIQRPNRPNPVTPKVCWIGWNWGRLFSGRWHCGVPPFGSATPFLSSRLFIYAAAIFCFLFHPSGRLASYHFGDGLELRTLAHGSTANSGHSRVRL